MRSYNIHHKDAALLQCEANLDAKDLEAPHWHGEWTY